MPDVVRDLIGQCRQPIKRSSSSIVVFRIAVTCLIACILGATSAIAESKRDGLAAALESHLAARSAQPTEPYFAALKRFYEERQFRPVWLVDTELNERALALQTVLGRAAEEGLDPKRYELPSIATDDWAALELGYSDTFLRYATDVQLGRRAPMRVDPDLFLYERKINHLEVLLRLVRAPDAEKYLRSISPQSNEYKTLRKVLADYRSLRDRGDWPKLRAGQVLKPGMTDAMVEDLRDRLERSGAVEIKPDNRLTFDSDLTEAVRDFQSRMGLESDGVVGKQTVSALNVSVERRIQQILLNMERARWMPDDLGLDYIFVNVADFRLKAVSHDKTELEMRVIIGKPYRRTPVFSEKLSHLEFNPSWTVPPRIAFLDLIPKFEADPEYFSKEGFVIYDGWRKDAPPVDPSTIQWRRYSVRHFPFRLQQRPGPKNALGSVKFMLPNKFDVYLHDTPAKELFGNANRAFSSGCIRLEHPMGLVDFVLRDQPEWTDARIDAVLKEGKTRVVKIKRPIMVHLTYSTAWVDAAGKINFRDDIYGRDKRLAAALGLDR